MDLPSSLPLSRRPWAGRLFAVLMGMGALGALPGWTSVPSAPSVPAPVLSSGGEDVVDATAAVGAPVPPDSLVAASAGLKESVTPRIVTETTGACPADMIEVVGDYCPNLEQKCLRWLDPDAKLRCAEFAPEPKCTGKTVQKHFCMDKYEYPNKAGATPVVMKTWYEARDACKGGGKRLCGSSEWTLACEGQEHLPYPYGFARSAEACNIDKPHLDVNERALGNPNTRDAEAARLDQRVPSGSFESCVSPYGVHDMAGNVDEWVVNESGVPYQSGSKGGYWGPVRTRCRPMTVAHYEMFSFYQLGFRCCANPEAEKDVPESDETTTPAAPSIDARVQENLELPGS